RGDRADRSRVPRRRRQGPRPARAHLRRARRPGPPPQLHHRPGTQPVGDHRRRRPPRTPQGEPVTTTIDIARTHGHTGPTNCQDCGTTENVHFGSWWNPETHEGGNFLQCCACGLKAGDPMYTHAECGAPATLYVPNMGGDAYSELAHKRIKAKALEAHISGQHTAAVLEKE